VGWKDLHAYPQLRFDIRYATPENFTGAVVPGYDAAGAWLDARATRSLLRAADSLARDGLGLLILDAYRPKRASLHFVKWARGNGRGDLVRSGYISGDSQHGRGLAVDLSLFSLSTGKAVDMGSAFDSFDALAHFEGVEGPAMQARRRLRRAMTAQGFYPYNKEWWHFTFKSDASAGKSPLPRDIVYRPAL
jgi:D-alanyl-D-alanine dipeptidase